MTADLVTAKKKVMGLTGGIGTGKSTAASYLREKGFAHVDADEISRGITADGSPMLQILDDVFGPEGEMGQPGVDILDEKGSLKRKVLGSIVFSDPEKKIRLDELMMGAIVEEIDRQIAAAHQEECCGIMLDAPLLFEVGLDAKCDLVLLIVADMDVRVQRVCLRDGISEKEVRDRISNQMSDDEKIARADLIVENSTTVECFLKELENFENYFTKFSKNS